MLVFKFEGTQNFVETQKCCKYSYIMNDWYSQYVCTQMSSLQCYSVLSDKWVKIELCIPLELESSVLSTGNASVCLSPLSKLKFTVLFCSIYKGLLSFSAILF